MTTATISTRVTTNDALELTFSDGTILTVVPEQLGVRIRHAAMLHGLKQKLCDAAAISRNPETGRSATLADKKAAVQAVYDRITGPNPSWNVVAKGAEAEGGLLLRALIELKPNVSRETLVVWLAGKTKAEQAALRASAEIAPVIDRLRPKADATASNVLLGELDSI